VFDSHALRVAQIKAVGGKEMTLDGRSFFGIFNDDDVVMTDFAGRAIEGRNINVELSEDDVQDARRGSRLVRGNAAYGVERIERFDAGMARLSLIAKQ
jgi:hypothetical protein